MKMLENPIQLELSMESLPIVPTIVELQSVKLVICYHRQKF